MFIKGIASKTETYLRWVLEDNDENIAVDYILFNEEVKCVNCNMNGCSHVKYIQSVLSVTSSTSTDNFIRNETGEGKSPEFIGKMQRAFDRAVGEKVARVEVTVKPKPPKPTPSPFSLIELD